MTCQICGRTPIWHGSEEGQPGTYLAETGCHDGVRMYDDEYHEGWQPDVIYPPCRFSPKCCSSCFGSGVAPIEHIGSYDCPDCDGTGWAGAEPEWPIAAEQEAA